MNKGITFLVSLAAILALFTGCSASDTSAPATSLAGTTKTSATLSNATGPANNALPGKIGGQALGGKPTAMTHPVAGFENCILCHGATGSALHLVDETVHACEQCHNASPEPEIGVHDNSIVNDVSRLNNSCVICHQPVSSI